MEMPAEYIGREQTWLKHRVLKEYLLGWAHKLGSVSRTRRVQLWYVDCFAGPWKQKNEELKDTSICIGLDALEAASRTWGDYSIKSAAIFVEKDAKAFRELQAYLTSRTTDVALFPIHGEFRDSIPEIERKIGTDAAFLFIDPTGWKGAAMQYIAPLAKHQYRDVLINVMFNDVNRFKGHPNEFIRMQLREFFGLAESQAPSGLGEEELMRLYRKRLKSVCALPHVADLLVPHPVHDRTKFRLVVGGHNPEVLRLFRQVEQKVIGAEASAVRVTAKNRDVEVRKKQLALFTDPPPATEPTYAREHRTAVDNVRSRMATFLSKHGPLEYGKLWVSILEYEHLTEFDLKGILWEMYRNGEIQIANRDSKERSIKDHHVLQSP